MLGKNVKTIGVINQAILLSYLSNDRLVLGRFSRLIHPFFPLLKTALCCFRFFDDFLIGRIYSFFGLNPGDR
jgi:hypothetical protein